MALHDDLRRQAWHLATREPRRPTQASLRRAVSAAYYALFHLLIDAATRQMVGASAGRAGLRHSVGRAFEHSSMVAVCKSVGSNSLPPKITSVTGPLVIPPDLTMIAQTFVKLQEARHTADYDLSRQHRRSEVRILLSEMDAAFAAWRRIHSHDTSRFFLIALALWKQMQR